MNKTIKKYSQFGKKLVDRDGSYTKELQQSTALGGLGLLPNRLLPDSIVNGVCGFCSTGCLLDIHLQNGEIVNTTPSANYSVNMGHACPKGWEATAPLFASDRALYPMMRKEYLGRQHWDRVSWDIALHTMVDRFKKIQQDYGNDSLAFLSTGQMTTEEMALLGAVTKLGMGIVHGDSNTRQCMATAATAYKQSFGFDAPPLSYRDFEESDCIVFVGANPCIAHPILWERVCKNQKNPFIVVVDPRITETASQASLHLAIRPSSDLALLYWISQILIQNGWIDHSYVQSHTEGFLDFSEFILSLETKALQIECGIELEIVYQLAKKIHESKAVSFWWTMGINQGHQATRSAQAIINLALMTGNIGRPGTGANSITGQTNAMGSRIFSNTSSMFCGRDFTSQTDREDVARILGVPINSIPDQNSKSYPQIIQAIDEGKIKGLWIIATNPSHTWINQKHFNKVLQKLDYLVVQDMYGNTETAKYANLILPAAGWGEKVGTSVNSERRISWFPRVKSPPAEALPDFDIFRLVGLYWGVDRWIDKWDSPASAFEIMKQLSKGRPCDISGIRDYTFLKEMGGIQWPYTSETGDVKGKERRLYEDGVFYRTSQRALFVWDSLKQHPEKCSESFPLVMLSGRGTSAQWHTQTRTGKSAVLRQLYPAHAYIEMNPKDGVRYGVLENNKVFVESLRGLICVDVVFRNGIKEGQVFMPMHYPEANILTYPCFDPYSHQPAYKYCAVRVSWAQN